MNQYNSTTSSISYTNMSQPLTSRNKLPNNLEITLRRKERRGSNEKSRVDLAIEGSVAPSFAAPGGSPVEGRQERGRQRCNVDIALYTGRRDAKWGDRG